MKFFRFVLVVLGISVFCNTYALTAILSFPGWGSASYPANRQSNAGQNSLPSNAAYSINGAEMRAWKATFNSDFMAYLQKNRHYSIVARIKVWQLAYAENANQGCLLSRVKTLSPTQEIGQDEWNRLLDLYQQYMKSKVSQLYSAE